MKKSLILLIVMSLLTGCGITKNDEYYKNVSDTVVSFYRNSNYKKSDFSSNDADVIEKYLSTLTHENQEIDITEYVNESTAKTLENDTKGVYKKNNKWFIKYNDLKFVTDSDIDTYAVVNCNSKTFTLFSSLFYPKYEETKNNRVYNYVYLGSQIEKNTKKYAYRSSYDGSGLIVTLELKNKDIVNINTSYENVKNFVSSNNLNNGSNALRFIIIIFIVIVGVFSIYKLYKNAKS
ncbi:MAG: hypothetical protein ACI4U0_06970 [Candidatus Aphodocola sp.]